MEKNGFKLIQKIGLKAMEFESTQRYTLEFNEAKSLAILVLNEVLKVENIESISKLLKEVTECEMD
jgi:hypothetical protein